MNKSNIKKIKFMQLRGTPAQKIRHRVVLGFTVATVAVGLVCSAFLNYCIPEPGKRWGKMVSAIRDNLKKKDWRPILNELITDRPDDGRGPF